jgi:hypothetical protein
MSSTITGSSSYSNSATVPSDGDAASASSVVTPLQTLLNNDRYLQQLLESTGIKLVRSVATLAALDALTSVANGEVAMVSGSGLVCLWRRNTAGTGSTTGLYRDHASEAGGWDAVRFGDSLFATDEYQDTSAYGTAISSTSSTSYTDTAATISIGGCKTSDIVIVKADFMIERTNTTYTSTAEVAITENGGSDQELLTTVRQVPTDAGDTTRLRTAFSVCGRHDITTSGTLVVKIRIKSSNAANTARLVGPGALIVQVYRPTDP